MKKTTVLIADDHKLLRETLTIVINGDSAFEVVASCADGMEATEIAEAERPDIILMDLNMTPCSGMEATARITAMNPAAKIIGMSTHAEQLYVQKMLRAGARGYVTKNSPKEELVHAMNRVLLGDIYICQEIKDILGQQLGNEPLHLQGLASLTGREMEVVEYIRTGNSSKVIAVIMGLAVKTVEQHRHNILKKLRLNNTAALINFIFKANYIVA